MKSSLTPGQEMLLRTFNEDNKYSGLATYKLNAKILPVKLTEGPFSLNNLVKARKLTFIGYTKEDFGHSPDMYSRLEDGRENKLSSINPQQSGYSWGTVELVKWKAYDGREATGMIFKPENFDAARKYPMIAYFYEAISDFIVPVPLTRTCEKQAGYFLFCEPRLPGFCAGYPL